MQNVLLEKIELRKKYKILLIQFDFFKKIFIYIILLRNWKFDLLEKVNADKIEINN